MSHNHIHAQVILAQLGGNRFVAMTGAMCFAATDNALHFKLPRNFALAGINYITIILMLDDTYVMEGWHCHGLQTKPVFAEHGLHAEDLQATFKARTGLDTHL